MTDLIIATRNRGKLNELAARLAGLPFRLLTLTDAGIAEEVEEAGTTFAENAIAKAVAYSRLALRLEPDARDAAIGTLPASCQPGEPLPPSPPRPSRSALTLTLADDSGLVVDALGGEPGILSARYGGPGLSDEDRCRLLLHRLEGVPEEGRTARFVCVLALAREGVLVRTFEGKVEGSIAFEPRGANGFGYDPVFYYTPLCVTFAELPPSEKDRVSHRGHALRAFREYAPTIS